MVAKTAPRPETFEFPLRLTGGLSAEEADRRIAVAVRGGDIRARELSFYLAGMAESGGYRCRNCRGRRGLSGHHKKGRRYGGRTVPRNILGACNGCHSLIHADLLFVRGTVEGKLRFVDAAGNALDKLTPAAREAVGGMTLELDAQPRPNESAGSGLAQPCHTDPDTRGSTPGPDDRDTRVSTPGQDDPDTRVSTPGQDDRDTRVSGVTSPGLDDLIGQEMVVRNLRRAVRAAVGRNEPLGHVLLCGPPGLGKTRIAMAVAADLGRPCRVLHAPFITEAAEIAREAAELPPGGVLFIDEVHRLPARVAESLYLAMETRRFTVIGATTDSGRLPGAFRSRFALREDLRYYAADELVEILCRAAVGLGVALDQDAAVVIAGASRDTPREALALLDVARDEVQLRGTDGTGTIDAATALEVLRSRDIDERGTTRIDREILEALRQASGPLGLATLADRIGVSRRDLLRVYEPFLVRRGLITRTRRGRVLN